MLAQCAKCQHVFETDRWGRQFCPQCGAELVLNPPEGQGPPAPGPVQPPQPGPVAPQPENRPEAALPPPGGPGQAEARCPVHPDRAAAVICGRCGRFACEACAASLNPPTCVNCASRAADADGAQDQNTPWEDREKLGMFAALIETIKRSLVDPIPFFARMRVDHTEGALSYFWITYSVGQLASMLWQLAFMALGMGLGSLGEVEKAAGLAAGAMGSAIYIGLAVVMVILAPVALYLAAGITHLGAMMVKANNHGFNATLRSVAYSSGPSVIALVPFCGMYVSGIWTLVLTIIGMWKTHRTTGWKATGAVLLPWLIIVCCFCVAGMAVAGIAGMAAATSGALPTEAP